MKKISEHLGQIIVALAGVALLIAACVVFRAPIGDFYHSIVGKETSIGDTVLAGVEDPNLDVSGNLIDRNAIKAGVFNPNTGKYSNQTKIVSSDFIPIEYGKTYKKLSSTYLYQGQIFDENFNYLGYCEAQHSKDNFEQYVTITNENAKYVSFWFKLCDKDYAYAYEISVDEVPQFTKSVAFLGDSITQGYLNDGKGQRIVTACSFAAVLGDKMNADVFNYGLNGSCFTENEVESIRSTALALPTDTYDMIVVQGGVNDYLVGKTAFGSVADQTAETFYGALNVTFDALTEKYPDKPIIVLTPFNTTTQRYDAKGTNPITGKTLDDYVAAIEEVCAQYDNIYVIDTHTWSHTNLPCDDVTLIPEKLHPTIKGHAKIADYVYKTIKANGWF